jgi:hypothetical protein
MSESMTLDTANIPAGWTAFLAVEQTTDGHIALALGTTPAPLPACLNSNEPLSTAGPANPTGTYTSTAGS